MAINLSETLLDEVALNYFSQFTELRGYSLLLTLWLDLQQLCKSAKAETDTASAKERTYRTQCASDSASPLVVTIQDLCHRYLSEEIMQRYRLPEDICARIQAAANQGVTDDEALVQLQDSVYQILRRE